MARSSSASRWTSWPERMSFSSTLAVPGGRPGLRASSAEPAPAGHCSAIQGAANTAQMAAAIAEWLFGRASLPTCQTRVGLNQVQLRV
jgi:hypothetical protein